MSEKSGPLIRIIYVASSLPPSGPTNQLLQLLGELDRTHFSPTLVVLSTERGGRSMRAEVPSDIPVYSLNLGRISGLVRGPRRLRKLLEWLDPEIVHTSGLRPDKWLAKMQGEWCHVTTLRNDPLEDYPSKFGAVMGRVLAHGHLRALRRVERPVACSSELATVYSQRYGIRAQAIQNGVDTNHYRPCEGGAGEGSGFVWVGSFIPRKDPELIFDAFQTAFHREGARSAVRSLSMLGEGPLRNKLASAPDHAGVRLTGAVDEPRPYYQQASWFVSSSHSEGLPNSALEALACGLPALLSDIPAHREIAEYAGEGVRLVGEQTVAAWADALEVAASDSNVERYGQSARKAAERYFSSKVSAERYMSLYKNLLRERGH